MPHQMTLSELRRSRATDPQVGVEESSFGACHGGSVTLA